MFILFFVLLFCILKILFLFILLYTLANYTALASIVYYDIDDVVLHNGSGHLLTWIWMRHLLRKFFHYNKMFHHKRICDSNHKGRNNFTWIFTIHGVCMKWVHHG